MKTFFITRFSIYDHSYHGYKITRNNNNKTYQNLLFSKDRLDFKFKAFEIVSLPSVLKQTNPNWEWHIYYSNKLSEKYFNKLFSIIKNYKNIKIYSVKDFKDFFKKVNEFNYGKYHATVRLDDDDGLSPNYVQLLNNYSEYNGKIISFPYGKEFSLKKNKIDIGINCRKPNIAIGLAAINGDIYACGDHSFIAKNYDVIYDLTKDMYLICCSQLTDTKRKRTPKKRFVLKTYFNVILGKYKFHIIKKNNKILSNLFYDPKKEQSTIFKIINIFLNIIGFQLLRKK